jgi:hypothetical protein
LALITTCLESYASCYRPKIGQDADGGTTQDFTPGNATLIFQNYACSVQEAGPGVQRIYEQRNAVVTNTVHFAKDPGCQPNELIVATAARTKEVVYLLVKGKAQPVARGRYYYVPAERIEQPF